MFQFCGGEGDPQDGLTAVFMLTEYQYGLLVDTLRDGAQRKRSCGLSGVANDIDNIRQTLVESRELVRG